METEHEEPAPQPATTTTGTTETRAARARRHGRRARLYAWAALTVAALVVLIALVAANVRSVKISWVFGSTHASLVWIVLASAVLGWLLGLATSVLFRFKTRSRRTDT
jgi:uncharacterized integral membrane protein